MSLSNKYFKDFNISKKHVLLNNISTDFTKTIKLLNNNYTFNNKNNLSNKKLFQNVKQYNFLKPNNNKYTKKRNYSYSSIYNNLTGGNLINNNTNNFISLFNSNIIKYNQKNYNTNINNTKPNKIIIKSKSNSNVGFIKKYPYKNLIIKTGEKNVGHKKKLFSAFGIINNLSLKNIKNYTKKISNSYKKNYNCKLHINKVQENIPKRSPDIQEKINKYKKLIENYKKEISIKDETIKKQMNKINEQNLIIQNIKKKYKKLEQDFNMLKNSYFLLKNKNEENENNIKIMTQKEFKLMQVLFLIKERGIDINSVLNEVNQISFNSYNQEYEINSGRNDTDNLNENSLSGITVYFPEKVKMKNIMETNWGKNIPKLNFGYVPEYTSENNTNKNEQNNMIVNDENADFFQNVGKYQHSA